ncbi:MAG: hypothetical protein JW809_06435 [Pirellulales bacterium]|nr:hypothetical protein [Pirellulales bacterium]
MSCTPDRIRLPRPRRVARAAGLALVAAWWSACLSTAAVAKQPAAAADPATLAATQNAATAAPEPSTEAATPSPTPLPVPFVRAFVPADRVEDWPRDQGRYVPMETAAFDNLIARVSGAPGPGGPRPEEVRVDARLGEQGLLEGRTSLRVAGAPDAPALVSLGRCRLAVRDAHWQGDPPIPAVLGAGENGALLLLADRSGVVVLAWSARGREGAEGNTVFRLDLPRVCGLALRLDLPAGAAPAVEGGLLVSRGPGNEGRETWTFALAPERPVVLRLAAPGRTAAEEPLAEVRTSVVYDFSPHGVEVKARLHFDGSGTPLGRVALALDPPLRLATAHWGERPAAWTVASGAGESPTRILIDPPVVEDAAVPELRLGAVAPPVRGGRWTLPRIRPQRTLWRQGEATLLVPEPLQLDQVEGISCRQSKVEPLSAPRVGQSIQLQYFSPDAAARVVLSQPHATATIDCGTSLELGGSGAAATVVAACRIENGERFELRAKVARDWILDRVESVPAGAVADWDVAVAADGSRQLIVRLAKPLAPGAAPLRLSVAGRWLDLAVGQPLALEDLLPLEFLDAQRGQELVALRAAESYRLTGATTTPLVGLDPADLDAHAAALLPNANPLPKGDGTQHAASPAAPSGSTRLVFARDDGQTLPRVVVRRQAPGFASEIETAVLAEGGMVTQTHRLRCVPDAPRIDHVVIHLSDDRPEPWRFTLGTDDDESLPARRLGPAEQSAVGVGPGGQTWDVAVVPPRIEPFLICAERKESLTRPLTVCLAALPEAVRQQARLTIGANDATALEIANRRLEPVPCDPAPAGRWPIARAAYRYGPADVAAAADEPAITVAAAAASRKSPDAAVWSLELFSCYPPHGGARHLSVLRVQNFGRKQIRITLPPDVAPNEVVSVWVDAQPSAWRVADARGAAAISVDLPAGAAMPTVAIDFSTFEPALARGRSLAPPVPAVDVPVLSRRWMVRLPPGYMPLRDACAQDASWTQRLFGPFGRPAGARPFDPLLGDDWRGLATVGSWGPRRAAISSAPAEAPSPAEPSKLPWPAALPAGWAPNDTTQWTVCRVALSETGSNRLSVVDADALEAARWLALLATVVLGRTTRLRRPSTLIAVGGAAAAAALLLPSLVAVVASGVWLGVLLCAAWGLARRASSRPASDGSRTAVLADAPTTACLILAVGILAGRAVRCPAADATPPDRAPYRVLIPMDSERKAAGDRVFVPEPLLRELHRLDTARAGRPRGGLLTGAVYRGAMAWQAPSKQLTLEHLCAEFDLRVFDSSEPVRTPLGRQRIEPSADGVRLDGQPIPPQYDPTDGALVLSVLEPGPHRLEVILQPSERADDASAASPGERGFDVDVPPLPQARLELSLPPGAPAIDVPTARGAVQQDGQRLLAEMGGADRLSVRWRDGAPGPRADGQKEVEELLWLRIAPGSVVLDARFVCHVLSGQLVELPLEGEPRLRLLESSPGVKMIEAPGKPGLWRATLEKPATEQVAIEASFLVTEASGVGSLRPPRLRCQHLRATRRWLAVSIDPTLRHELVSPRPLEPVAVPDFLKAWGDADAPPQFVRDPRDETNPWTIASWPRPGETVVEQMVVVSCGPHEAEAHLDANLQTTPGHGFHYAVQVPSGFVAETLRVLEDGADRVARWSQGPDGTIHVSLAGPAAGARRLLLDGRLALDHRGQGDLPIPQVIGGRLQKCQVAVFRRPGVLVRVADAAGLVQADAPVLAQPKRSLGWHAGSFVAGGETPPVARLLVEPNRPRITAVQSTSVCRAGAAYEACLEFEIDVASGPLDQIELDVPPGMSGPFRTTPAMEIVDQPSSGSNRLLVLRPQSPLTGRVHLTFAGVLEGEPLRVPNVALRGAAYVRRLVVLPSRLDDQPVLWETRGLKQTTLPARWSATRGVPAGTAYEVSGDAFHAGLIPSPPEGKTPRVEWADTRVVWQADGACAGVARFDLIPAGRAACPLRVPEGTRLLQVVVAGAPTCPLPVDERLDVALASREMPQRIEVAFSRPAASGGAADARMIEAPQLGDLPVAATSWTVCVPRGFSVDWPRPTMDLKPEDADREAIPDGSLAGPWSASLPEDSDTIVARTDGPAPSIAIVPPAAPWLARRLPAALAATVLAALAYLAARRSLVSATLRRWPPLLGALAGVFWWLFLWPSALGGVIALASLAAWRRRDS